jgi:hypothetical protein
MAAKKSGKDAAPDKQGRLRQIWTVFTITRRNDPALVWWLLASVLGPIAIGLVLGILIGHPIYLTVISLMIGLTIALYVLTRRAERMAFNQIIGQPGASAAALQNLRKGWTVEQEPVGIDPRTQDLVFRVIGRPGVILVTEGPVPRVNRIAEQERKRVSRVLGQNVPVQVVHAGEEDGQIPLRKLASTLTRKRPVLTKDEVTEVAKRLRALGGARPPIPKGVDPMRIRPDRKASRGR